MKKKILVFVLIVVFLIIFVLVLLKIRGKDNKASDIDSIKASQTEEISVETNGENSEEESDGETSDLKNLVEPWNMHIFRKDAEGNSVENYEDKSKIVSYVFTVNIKNISGNRLENVECKWLLKDDNEKVIGTLPFYLDLDVEEEGCYEMGVDESLKDAKKFEFVKVN